MLVFLIPFLMDLLGNQPAMGHIFKYRETNAEAS